MTAADPLDRYASRVTPHGGEDGRRRRYRLRAVAGTILQTWRVSTCGQKACQSHVDAKVHDGRAYFAGIETCGSVWACPVCAAKIAETRKAEVEAACEKHVAEGGQVYMATLTVRHCLRDRCADLRDMVADTWRRVQAGAPWQRKKRQFGIRGLIRSLEVTHGANGWHPHLHVLVLTAGDAEDFGPWLFERWARFIEKRDHGVCDPAAFKWERMARVSEAGDYVAKWGCAAELTKAHMKDAGAGNRSPWQLLEAAGNGDKKARWLFREYAEAFKGARQLTWTLGLKSWAGIDDDTDAALAAREAAEIAETVITFPARVFRQIVRKGLDAAVLEAAEDGGQVAVLLLLKSEGVEIDGGAPPSAKSVDREFRRRSPDAYREPEYHGRFAEVARDRLESPQHSGGARPAFDRFGNAAP